MDLSKPCDVKDYEKISEETKDIDISILVNNAGVPGTDLLKDTNKDLMSSIVHVNAGAPTFLM